jgi:hypothetical protein
VGINARGAKHYDGVANAFFFQLGQRVEVLCQDADGASRGAGHELVIFVRGFWSVLRLWALTIGHRNLSK